MRPLAVSMGDPAGVGLEIAARAFASGSAAPFFLIGDPDALARAAARAGLAPFPTRVLNNALDATGRGPALEVLSERLTVEETPGAPEPANSHAVARAIERGVRACLDGAASGLVTLPIAKAQLKDAGAPFPGHTEYVAHLARAAAYDGERGPVMMLAHDALRVTLATIHLPLAQVPAAITHERIVTTARVTHEALRRDFGIAAPRLALAALNPHAGEDGALGREEIDILNPTAAALRAEGVAISDARSADALFHAEAREGYDAVVAMYHDQGLIPIKTLDFWAGVNVTLGLPLIRTSPDHGTAHDLAGRGLARADSFLAALHCAAGMAQRRARG